MLFPIQLQSITPNNNISSIVKHNLHSKYNNCNNNNNRNKYTFFFVLSIRWEKNGVCRNLHDCDSISITISLIFLLYQYCDPISITKSIFYISCFYHLPLLPDLNTCTHQYMLAYKYHYTTIIKYN